MHRSHFTIAVAMLAAVAAGSGCRGRALAPNAADGLRAELVERTRERDLARAKVAELETKVAELSATRDARVDPEAIEARPALAAVVLSSLSTARRSDASSATLALVLEPRDALGRFIQITGTVRASVAALVPGRDPLPAGSATLGPKALRDCYRTGFLGTHYTVEIPVKWEGAEVARAVSVSAEFTDALTGKAYICQGTVPVIAVSTGSEPKR
ncbi:MAG: hypothetical protein ACO31E_02345 [Phycisphaerales bacterium]